MAHTLRTVPNAYATLMHLREHHHDAFQALVKTSADAAGNAVVMHPMQDRFKGLFHQTFERVAQVHRISLKAFECLMRACHADKVVIPPEALGVYRVCGLLEEEQDAEGPTRKVALESARFTHPNLGRLAYPIDYIRACGHKVLRTSRLDLDGFTYQLMPCGSGAQLFQIFQKRLRTFRQLESTMPGYFPIWAGLHGKDSQEPLAKRDRIDVKDQELTPYVAQCTVRHKDGTCTIRSPFSFAERGAWTV